MKMISILSELESRGCVHDVSHRDELEELFKSTSITFYCGFDPTADSLHVGHMLPLLLMRRMQKAGHKPIALLGTATGMIGDPSGKSEERKLLTQETIAVNAEAISKQIAIFLDTSGEQAFELLRNDSWLGALSLIDFLRDTGKHFSVNAMMAKESVKNRLENRDQGISYTEFSYMMLQAYDYYWLHQHRGCRLQVGGSDQWGNITAGLDLIRRRGNEGSPSAYGFTFPLLTTSSGSKFGKTEAGAVWLDPARTSPYRFYQFWMNTEDADVIRLLNLFTDVSSERLESLKEAVADTPQKREAQSVLAEWLTTLVHGEEEFLRAQRASGVLFGGELEAIDVATLCDIFSDVPSSSLTHAQLKAGISLVDVLVGADVAASKGAARRSIEAGGIYLNNQRVAPDTIVSLADTIDGQLVILRSGKRSYHLIKVTQ